jgi:LuxR family maltose regulon positive regulatory protein
LVSAPAGYGKSVLISSWLRLLAVRDAAPGPRTAWLSVDDADNDLINFWSYLVAAIESAYPDSCPATVELLALNEAFSPERYADVLADECQELPGPLVLALDDYHVITDSAVHKALARWLTYLHEALHIVLICRADPPLHIAQMRARGQLSEIRSVDLQFSVEETTSFLAAALARPRPPHFDQQLHDQTEGWAAGLRLAAISLRARADLDAAARELAQNSHRYIADYLVGQVLESQPPDVQDFLLRTSILPRLCAGLCAAVLASVDARACQHMLEYLDRRNVFLIELDDHRGWYRYHHQFQKMLQQRLRSARKAGEIDAAQRRAAGWLAADGLLEDALGVFLALGDYDQAEALLVARQPELEMNEDWRRLGRLLEMFPAEIVQTRPALLLARAWERRTLFAEPEVLALAAAAETLLDADAPQAVRLWDEATVRAWRGELDALRGITAANIPLPDRLVLTRRALARLPDDRHWIRNQTTVNLALAQSNVTGNIEEGLAILDEALSRTPPGSMLSVRLVSNRAVLFFYAGGLFDLKREVARLHELAAANDMQYFITLVDYALGEAHYLQNELDAAQARFDRVLERGFAVNWQARVGSLYRAVSLAATRRDLPRGQQLLKEIDAMAAEVNAGPASGTISALRAYHAFLSGDLTLAADWAERAKTGVRSAFYADDTAAIILVEILLAQGTPGTFENVELVLNELAAYGASRGTVRTTLHALTLLARLHRARGDDAAALDALERAVEMGHPLGYVRWFIESDDLVELLARLVRLGRHSRECSALLLARQSNPTQAPTRAPIARTGSPLIEPLTEREADILVLMAEALTNKEIAARLRISPLTVRNHGVNLFAKLGASTRRQAVAKGQALGLLPMPAV